MIKYYKYRKKPKRFLALTGFTVEEFDALLPEFVVIRMRVKRKKPLFRNAASGIERK